MMIKCIAGIALAASVTACGTSGGTDTMDLLSESAQACSIACTEHPDIDSFSFAAGGGSPLLFSGKFAASCDCSDERR